MKILQTSFPKNILSREYTTYYAFLYLQSSLYKIRCLIENKKPVFVQKLFNYSDLYLSGCFYFFAVNAFLMFLNCLVLTDLG